jgi:hypothetical protein
MFLCHGTPAGRIIAPGEYDQVVARDIQLLTGVHWRRQR